MPGVAEAKKSKKKKKDLVSVLSYNLYLGSDLADATNAGLASRTDLFADEVGEVLSEVQQNDFATRAQTIARDIKKQKVDIAGLQEAALWKLEFPTDGGGPPRGSSATTPLIDYIDTLLNALNQKAKTKKQCKKKGLTGNKCYRGYYLVGFTQEADVEQIGDFDNNPGPNGQTYDVSGSATIPCPGTPMGAPNGPGCWTQGNDDTGVNLGEPPAAQCSDGIDNDGDTKIDWGPEAGNEPSDLTPPADDGTKDCIFRGDNSEAPGAPAAGLPQDANFDSHAYVGGSGDITGTGLDGPGVEDCAPAVGDENPNPGPALGFDPDGPGGPLPPWPFAGYNAPFVPVCMFHGIDGDIRLQMRDAIIARKGAGVKTSNVTSQNYGNTFQVAVFGTSLKFTRGWIAADVSVRGKKFHLLNTHLESESVGSVREDQAAELVGPLGAATHPRTVLVGDLNSDPARAPVNLPNGDGGSNIAINRLFAAGLMPIQAPGFSGGHGELLNDLSNTLDNGRIDHILTNDPLIQFRSGLILDSVGGGLWASDHGGVLSRLAIPGGKKKGKK
jgi:Endonuclease/Exonuclease/phosphatase family